MNGHVLRDTPRSGSTGRMVALTLAFVAAAGLGAWTAWTWAEAQEGEPPAPAVGDRSQPVAAERREAIAESSTGGAAAATVGSTGSTGGTVEAAEGSTGRAADAGRSGEDPARAGASGDASASPAGGGKTRPGGKRTEGKKAGTTGAGKDDRPKLKTDVYDD